MAWQTLKTVDWSAISSLPAPQWLPHDLARGEVPHFPLLSISLLLSKGFSFEFYSSSLPPVLGDICLRRGSRHETSYCFSQRALHFSYSESLSCCDYQTSRCLHHSSFDRKPSSRILHSPFLWYFTNSFVSYCNGYSAVCCNVRDFVGYFYICTIITRFVFFSFWSSSSLPSVPATVPTLTVRSSAAHLLPATVASPPQTSSSSVDPSSVQPSVAPKHAASSTPPRGSFIALLHERLARRDAAFAELNKAFLAFEDHIRELELSLAQSTSDESNPRFQISALRANLAATRTDHTTSQSFITTASSEFDKLRADSWRLASHILNLIFTADSLRL